MANYILAFDLGTSSLKATAFSDKGTLTATASRGYQTKRKTQLCAEQEPEDWWNATVSASREILKQKPARDISCVVLSGQMGGCVYLDTYGELMQPASIWQDGRGSDQLQRFNDKLNADNIFDEIYRILFRIPSGVMPIGRIMWMKEECPDVYNKIGKVIGCKDYLAYKFTGAIVTDNTEASATGLFDLKNMIWSDRMFKLTGLDRSIMPETVPSITVVGKITKWAAEETGLCLGTPLVIGAGDGCAAVIGTGMIADGEMHCSVGTSGWCGISTTSPVLDVGRYRNYSLASAIPGMYVSFINVEAAGLSYEWLANLLSETGGGKHNYTELNKLAQSAAGGTAGLLYLPYITTDICLHKSTFHQGAFLNMSYNHTAGDFARAVIEGVAFYLGNAIEIYAGLGYAPQEIVLIGGSMKEPLWRRIICDALGVPCKIIAQAEYAVSAGAAIIGGVGCGMFNDFSVSKKFVRTEETLLPDMKKNQFYRKLFAVSEDAYLALESINAKIRQIIRDAECVS